MSGIRKENPQRILSKSLLTHALLELMKDTPYREITITELTKKADLSRRTFYRHYTAVDEVLDYTFQQISEQFYAFQMDKKPKELKMLVYIYFLYWQEHKDFLKILKTNHLLYRLQDRFSLTAKNRDTNTFAMQTDTTLIEYAVCFTSGAIWSLLVKWLENGAVQSPKEMAEIAGKVLDHIKE